MNLLMGFPARFEQIRGIAIIVLVAAALWGQGPPSPPPLPPHVLYEQFFLYQSHLDSRATAVAKLGKNGSDYANHFQQRLAFTDKQYVLVRAEGQKLAADLSKQDAKARAVIDAGHKLHPPGRIKDASEIPRLPPELTTLQQERDQIVMNHVEALKTALGPTAAARLEAVVQSDIAPHVTLQTVPVAPHDPKRQPVPTFSGVR